MIPSVLKNGVGMKSEVIIAGALNKIELWPKEVYERDLAKFIGGESEGDLQQMMEEAFSLLSDNEEENEIEMAVERVQKEAVKL
jgi:MraZ protein